MIDRYLTQRPRRRKRKPNKADPQANKVYDMERCMVGACIDNTTNHKTLNTIVKHACREWGLVRPALVVAEYDTKIFGEYIYSAIAEDMSDYPTHGTILLNAGYHGQNIHVLLHELAHHIIWRRHGHSAQDHGPEFVAVYRYLLDRYNVIPSYAFDAILDRWGVEYDLHYRTPR